MFCPLPLRLISLACLSTVMASAAQAQSVLDTLEPGYPYIGLEVGQTRAALAEERIANDRLPVGTTATVTSVDKKATSSRFLVGYQFNRYVATELGFFNLGKYGFKSTTTSPAGTFDGQLKYRGLDLDVVGTLPVTDNLSLLGRAGLRYAKVDSTFTGSSASLLSNPNHNERGANYKIGAGLQYAFSTHFLMRAEVDRFKVSDAVGNHGAVTVMGLGFIVPFGHVAPPPPKPYMAPMVSTPAPVAAYVAPAPVVPVQVIKEPSRRRVSYSVESLFGFDVTTLRPEGKVALDNFVRELDGTRYDMITVEGHSDRLGTPEYNLTLSQQRADVVKAYLVTSGRVDPAKIASTGKGETMPLTQTADCKGKEPGTAALITCLQPDRRVDIEVSGTR